ncbi:hypothetical protein B0T26DRAFT_756329 [Lasiosphaeria miniovina]|uniref:Nephrocystin 3-like N-terminal domain-containing protein n=1 Tax=Lasiosphaeria miniovina TaxID=1954250 RepID=A0AA40A0P5_9PEZI|nr:uncharacterized protein B0T26DRAFT_756329 [Lasiosphaeria miniovina]KAK0706899.1 hypothetical protein B0T26DRAFT_756329 [Lasiosphaeria miniovina]
MDPTAAGQEKPISQNQWLGNEATTSEQLFDAAIQTAQHALTEEDQRHFRRFKDHRDMIKDLQADVYNFSASRTRLTRCAKKIASFSEAFAPFFDVIGVLLQVGSNFIHFLERVSEMFEELSFFLPQYQQWFQTCRLNPSIKDRGRLERALMGTELMLRPFEARFSQLKERLTMQKDWFEREAAIHEHALLDQLHGDFRHYIQDSEEKSQHRDELGQRRSDEDIKDRVHEGTGLWFLQRPEYQRLKTMDFVQSHVMPTTSDANRWLQRVLFLKDLAQTVLPSGDAPTVAYFHFDQQKKSRTNSSDEALRAIAEQLIHSHRRSRISLDALALIETDSGSGQYTPSRRDIRLAIDILLRQHPSFLVFDGIDECSEPARFLEELRSICIEHDYRAVLLGRPSVEMPYQ